MSSTYIPIVFIHKGYSWYLNYTARQAHISNKDSEIYIIGDAKINKFSFAKSVQENKYENSIADFVSKYKHLSSNDPVIERFCFERWFLLRDLMKEYGLSKVVACDSDIMLYCDVTAYEKKIGSYLAAYCIPHNQDNFRLGAAAHISFWTYEGINQFCSFITHSYSVGNFPQEIESKWKYVVENNIPGGVTDMPFLYLFARENKIVNLSPVNEGSTFDDNVNSSENFYKDEYVMEKSIKKIIWKESLPYGITKESKEVLFNALHCQGVAKGLTEEFYKLNQGALKTFWVKQLFKLGKLKRKLT